MATTLELLTCGALLCGPALRPAVQITQVDWHGSGALGKSDGCRHQELRYTIRH